jgi:hypothetical protein
VCSILAASLSSVCETRPEMMPFVHHCLIVLDAALSILTCITRLGSAVS